MSRGFLIGAGWGTVVAGFGLAVASQISDFGPVTFDAGPLAMDVARADTPDVPQDTVPDLTQNEAAGIAPAVPGQGDGPSTPAAPDVLTANDLTPDEVPNTVDAASASVPQAQTSVPAPDAPGVAALAPIAPLADRAAPIVEQGAALPDGIGADTPPATDTPPASVLGAEAALPERDDPIAAIMAELAPPIATPAAPEAIAELPAEPVAEPAPESAPESDPESDIAATRPAPGFGGKVEGVKTGRLPAIGRQDQPSEPETAPEETILADDPNLPAIERFAAEFENPSNKPLFAILLQDTGGSDIDREALAGIDFPVTFVIDPTQPDAAMAARIYRAKGKEVLMLATGIPEGATASDVSVSMEVITAALPEAVGVVDLEDGGFQGNRTLATQVLALLRDQGRGILTWDKGLNAASQVARREGMRSAVIFRSLDAEDEASPVIRRYLDRAAFKAAQDGRVVVAGKTRPETVAALLEWALEGRAATVALAPSTAVMTSQ